MRERESEREWHLGQLDFKIQNTILDPQISLFEFKCRLFAARSKEESEALAKELAQCRSKLDDAERSLFETRRELEATRQMVETLEVGALPLPLSSPLTLIHTFTLIHTSHPSLLPSLMMTLPLFI
jgi:hypothetical protein